MRYLSIKNLAKHQHYKDRNPPWIKLHASLLSDYTFGCLQDASKAHLMLLWVLASRLDNSIPYDLAWITGQLGATSPVDIEELVQHGFIEVGQDDGKTLAPRKQSAMPETETETEERQSRVEKGLADSVESVPKVKNGKAPRDAPVAWVVEGVEWWTANVGVIAHGRFGKALSQAVGAWTWAEVFPALKCYAEDAKARNKPAKPEWFSAEVIHWLEWAKMAVTDDNGLLTPRGVAMTREERR